MDYEEYKRKALEPIVSYIESVMASYSKEELEARIKKALPEKESEDERIRKEIIQFLLLPHPQFVGKRNHEEWIDYLEKQKDEAQKQFNLGVQAGREEAMYEMDKEQKPTEWSEEEKGILLESILALQNSSHWLLADRLLSLRPKPHWKPSEEQMRAIEYFIRSWGESGTMSPQNPTLCAAKSLYNDLKKLM